MAIDVRIPTILRPYTKDQKRIGERLLEDGALRRFINVYINDEDVRFLGGLDSQLKDGDSVTILPAVAGG